MYISSQKIHIYIPYTEVKKLEIPNPSCIVFSDQLEIKKVMDLQIYLSYIEIKLGKKNANCAMTQ
jgi:hypothetical protein